MTVWQWAVCGLVVDHILGRLKPLSENEELKDWEPWQHVLYSMLIAAVTAGAFAIFGYLWNL